MYRISWAMLAVAVMLPSAASAHTRHHHPRAAHRGIAVRIGGLSWTAPARPAVKPACPAGVPVRVITVINDAGVSSSDLALVEHAATDQSLQVRAAWNSPCISFGPGGVPLTLDTGCAANTCSVESVHMPNAITVGTGLLPGTMWARSFTHETDEWAVDPSGQAWVSTGSGTEAHLEICDPVENLTYSLDGVQVSDFVTPSYYSQL